MLVVVLLFCGLCTSRSGPGSHFGTISGPIEAFSAANKDKDKYKSPGRNFTTTPGKKGTGYGWVEWLCKCSNELIISLGMMLHMLSLFGSQPLRHHASLSHCCIIIS